MASERAESPRRGVLGAAYCIGALVTLMISLNGQLAQQTSQAFALVVIHLAGLSAVIAAFIITRTPPAVPANPLPWYFYSGGVIGVFMVFGSNVSFGAVGASLTLASGVLGQTAGSLTVDTAGLFGMRKYRFIKEKWSGLAVICLGIFVMAETWRIDGIYIILAMMVGAATVFQMILNARLASKIGLFRGVGINYIGGLSASVLALMLTGGSIASFSQLDSVPLYLILGGGLLGFIVVTSMNTIVPKIPTFYSALLVFLGQISAGLIIDALLLGIYSPRRTAGAVLIFIGLMLSVHADRRRSQPE